MVNGLLSCLSHTKLPFIQVSSSTRGSIASQVMQFDSPSPPIRQNAASSDSLESRAVPSSYSQKTPDKNESALIDVFTVNMKSLDDENGPRTFRPLHNPSPNHLGHDELDLEHETSSTESFPLIESTEAPSSFTSHFSSNSSLSGFFKSPRSSIGTPSTGHNSKRRDSRSDNGSFTFRRDKKDNAVKKAYLKLQSQCSKFKSQNNAVKANYLRLTLLPFLRNHTGENSLLPANSQVELALKVFTGWWSECLDVLKSNFRNVAGVDRDAFYEAVSSLMARPEWLDHQDKPAFQNLLSNTLIHLLTKCATSVHISLSLAAITGKCLAYSYLYLPYVAVYLLDMLDVSPAAIKRLGDVDIEQFLSSCYKNSYSDSSERLTPRGTPALSASATASSSASQQASFINSFLHYHHPSYLEFLVDAREKPSVENLAHKMPWFPFDNFRNWKRYFTIDSPLFVSFFKHLCVLQTQCLPISSIRDGVEFGDETKFFAMHGEATILNSPGMRLIFASIVTYLDKVATDSGRSTSPRNSNPYGPKGGPDSPKKGRYSTGSRNGSSVNEADNFKADAVASPYSNAPTASPQRFRADRLKLFTAMREILHSDETTVPYVLAYSRIFDRIFRAFALNIRAYDVDRCVIACDLAEEWIYSVAAVRATKACPALVSFKSLALDWDIWLLVMKRMLSTDNIHTEIRALSFLYNVWPYLPNNDSQVSSCASTSSATLATKSAENLDVPITPMMQSSDSIIPDTNPKTTVNVLTEWLLSADIWLQFFCHWCPLVRSYYHRLVCYRVASVGEESGSWFLDAESVQYISESRKLLQKRLISTFLWCNILSDNTKMRPEVIPSLPMPRMRVGVRPVGPVTNANSGKIETNVSRVFPFDVFDSAAYWQRDSKDQVESVAIRSGTTPQSSLSVPSAYETANNPKNPSPQRAQSSPEARSKALPRSSSSPHLRANSPYGNRTRSTSRASSMWSNNSTTSTIGEVSPSDEFPDRGIDESTAKPNENTHLSPSVNSKVPAELNPIMPTTPNRDEAKDSTEEIVSPGSGSFASKVTSSPLRLRRKDKLSHSSPNVTGENSEGNIKSRSSSLTNLKGSYLQKRWGTLRKLISGKESSDTAIEESNDPNGEAAQPDSQYPSSQLGDKNMTTPKKELKPPFVFEDFSSKSSISSRKNSKKLEKQNYLKAAPVELTRPRPEVVRPPHRFVMIPTSARPPLVTEIQLPKLPFSSRVMIDESTFDCQNRNQDKDLAIWNYAGRSLAEWNIEVSCFESFIKLQEKKFNETLEMFNMPFLVAEIPWRTSG